MTQPRIFVNSIPKSGTHLLGSILEMMANLQYQKPVLARNLRRHPFNLLPSKASCLVGIGQPQKIKLRTLRYLFGRLRPGYYVMGHIPYQDSVAALLEESGIHTFFVIRDPRDVIVSQAPYYLKHRSHYLHRAYKSLGTEKERLIAAIRGIKQENGAPQTFGIAKKLSISLGWMEVKGVMTLRFEEMIGEHGDGRWEEQQAAIMAIGRQIGLEINAEEALLIGERAFGKGRTYRQGKIGGWRGAFDDEVKEIFKQEAGEYLLAIGYETGSDW